MAKYQRSYASKAETLNRFQVFKDNFRAIKAHNSLGEGVPFNMEINQFADISDKEFEEKYIGQGIKRRGPGQIRPFTVEEVSEIESKMMIKRVKKLEQGNTTSSYEIVPNVTSLPT